MFKTIKRALGVAVLITALCQVSLAQTEVKLNPIALLFSNISAGVEFGLSEDFGIEPRLLVDFNSYEYDGEDSEGLRVGVIVEGKYYFNPEVGIDKWYIGAYTKFLSGKYGYVDYDVNYTRFALGFLTGYKWVSSKNIVFELGLGVGRAFVNDWETEDETIDLSGYDILSFDLIGKFAVGYRS